MLVWNRDCVVFAFVVAFVFAFVPVFVVVPVLLCLSPSLSLIRAASVFVFGYESVIVSVVRGSCSCLCS